MLKFLLSVLLKVWYENHFTASQQLRKENSLNELIISKNRPNLHEADGIIQRALNDYWLAKSENEKWRYFEGSSKVIGKLLSEPSKLPFMTL